MNQKKNKSFWVRFGEFNDQYFYSHPECPMCKRFEQMRLILAILIVITSLTYLTMFMEGMESQCCRKVAEINKRVAEITGNQGGSYLTSDAKLTTWNTTLITEEDAAAIIAKTQNENHIKATIGNITVNNM